MSREVVNMRNLSKKLDRVIRKPEVLNAVGLSDCTVWRMERTGKFPKRIKLGPQSVGWFESEIVGWLNERAADR